MSISLFELEQKVKNDPTSAVANFALGQEYFKIGNNDLALKHALQAVQYGHKQADAEKHAYYYVLASRILVKQGFVRAAEAMCRHALAIGLNTIGAYKGLGEVMVATKQKEQALQCIDAAIARAPLDASLKQWRSKVVSGL